jgi:hypothetical protein
MQMSLVRKRSGEYETFDSNKLLRSILRAGASRSTAVHVLIHLRPREDLSSADIRTVASALILEREPQASMRYKTARMLTVRTDPSVIDGTAHLGASAMCLLGVDVDDAVVVSHGGTVIELRVEQDDRWDGRSIAMSASDFGRLGLPEGRRTAVRRRS